MSFSQALMTLKQLPAGSQQDEACLSLLTQATMTMLGSQRLYGELLLRLPKRVVHDHQAAVKLQVKPELTLLVDPAELIRLCQTPESVVAILAHVLGHLIWHHIDRYGAHSEDPLVQLATDMAVNEYVSHLPQGAITRSQLNYQYHLNLQPKQDSGVYLRALKKLNLGTQQQGRSFQPGSATQLPTVTQLDSHADWHKTDAQATLAVDQLLSQAWHGTPVKQRGLLPSQMQQQLQVAGQPLRLDWRQLLQRGLGSTLKLRDDAYNRFDRRQPYRLELPGTRVSPVRTVLLFVDQSGSMSDAEVSSILGQVMTLIKRYQDTLVVIPFDAVVHADQAQTIRRANQLDAHRFGGGGTAYQPIFDWLLTNGYRNDNAVALILTDGHGEEHVSQHRFTNVIWGLTTTVQDLSVENPSGAVTIIA